MYSQSTVPVSNCRRSEACASQSCSVWHDFEQQVRPQVNERDTEACITDDEWWVDTWLDQIRIAVCTNTSDESDSSVDKITTVNNVKPDELAVPAVHTNHVEVTKQDNDVPIVKLVANVKTKPLELTKQDSDTPSQVVDSYPVNIYVKNTNEKSYTDIHLRRPSHYRTLKPVFTDVKPGCSGEHLQISRDNCDKQTCVKPLSHTQQTCRVGSCSLNGNRFALSCNQVDTKNYEITKSRKKRTTDENSLPAKILKRDI